VQESPSRRLPSSAMSCVRQTLRDLTAQAMELRCQSDPNAHAAERVSQDTANAKTPPLFAFSTLEARGGRSRRVLYTRRRHRDEERPELTARPIYQPPPGR